MKNEGNQSNEEQYRNETEKVLLNTEPIPPFREIGKGTMAPPLPTKLGFTAWDYATCSVYLLLTFYVSVRSAFSKPEGKEDLSSLCKIHEKKSEGDDETPLLDESVVGVGTSAEGLGQPSARKGSGRKNKAMDEYFLAGRSQTNVIVAISLLSGLNSGISFLGVPAYGYEHGAGLLLPIFVAQVASGYIVSRIIPFYCKLGLTPYAYLEKRYSKRVRTAAACLFCIRVLAYMTVVIKAPAILFEATAKIEQWVTALVCGALATLFTMKGGMKTVIVTDFMQSFALVGGALLTFGLAVAGSSGLNSEDLRVEAESYLSIPSWGGDNFWYFLFGILFNTVCQCGTDQIAIQRLLSTKDVATAQRASIQSGWLNGTMSTLLVAIGLFIHAYYRGAGVSPLEGDGTANDIMPYFLMRDSPPGFLGIVIAAVLGCTLSVLSGGLNGLATCFYVDVMENALSAVGPGDKVIRTSKFITLAAGVIVTILAVLSTYIEMGIVNFSNLASGLFIGPVGAVFLLGMLTKRIRTRNVEVSFVFSMVMIVYVLSGELTCAQTTLGTKKPPVCNGFFFYAQQINAWMVAAILGGATAFVAIASSFFTGEPQAGG